MTKKVFLTGLAIFLAAFLVLIFIQELRSSARNSANKALLAAYYTAQKSYFDEYKEYSKNFDQIGFRIDLKNHKIYFDANDLPSNLKIPDESRPFFKKASFKALMVVSYGDSYDVWEINDSGKIDKIKFVQ